MRAWSRREIGHARAMLMQRLPLRFICERLGRTRAELWHMRLREGLTARYRKRAGDERRDGVVSLSAPGVSDGEVAKALGCSVATVVRHRQALGIPPGLSRGGRWPRATP